ncbi:MAG TPA: hypothetical protein VIB00_12495 [Pyrinomonadaceae bacterium]|jgi:nitrate reductase delta subunit
MSQIHEHLADLLEYPLTGWEEHLTACQKHVRHSMTELQACFATFADEVEHLSIAELEEIYTGTFDLSPVCALEIGYHLFGENYKRGVFLANLRETESLLELGQEHQLPDYLPVVLRLLSKLEDKELRGSLIVDCIIPALERMLKTLSGSDNPYRHLITAATLLLNSEARVHPVTVQRAHLPILMNSEIGTKAKPVLF